MLRKSWDGVGLGWGGVGMITFFELAHMVGATQVMGWGGVGMVTFLALAHMVGATQVMGWVGVGWCGDGNVPWTCTHGRCYATSCSLNLHTWSVLRKSWDGLGWGGVGMVTFLELAHMVGATQHHVPCTCTHGRCYASHGIGVVWGGDDNVPWTCQHGWCYARSWELGILLLYLFFTILFIRFY